MPTQLVTGRLTARALPDHWELPVAGQALHDLWERSAALQVECGNCLILNGETLHLPSDHLADGDADGILPGCEPTSTDPMHRHLYVGYAHTHPWVDGEPYPGFSAGDFCASLYDGDSLSLVCNGPRLFALVRTADRTLPQQAVSQEELIGWERIYRDQIYVNGRRRSGWALDLALWDANCILCEKTGFALYVGDRSPQGCTLNLSYRP